jgi:hypothetical protein
MTKTRSFGLPEELALKLEGLTKGQGKRVEALLADVRRKDSRVRHLRRATARRTRN